MSEFKLFAVAGKPVLHSKSPVLFNPMFQKASLNCVYSRIAADSASEAMSLFKELNLAGMNVTAPFKLEIMSLLDEINKNAAKIGTINTVVKTGGNSKGFNTDYIGVVDSLISAGIHLKNKRCLVLGAGGAGRAAVYGLKNQGAFVTVINRTAKRANEVATNFNCKISDFTNLESLLESTDILISTLAPEADVIHADWLRGEIVVFDANYKESHLAMTAKKKGCRFIRGDEWLLYQAMPAYKLFTNKKADEELLRQTLNIVMNSRHRKSIALIGFMGCGKSTVAKQLSNIMDFSAFDTDDQIEQVEGQTISEIFESKGEAYFREVEKSVVRDLKDWRNTVIACGGGIILDEENRRLLRENAVVVWLYAPVDICVQRISDKTRPLLHCKNALNKAEQLFKKRIPYYAQSTDLIVDAQKSISDISRKIYEEIHQTFGNFR